MPCARCGGWDHDLSQCPWPLKRTEGNWEVTFNGPYYGYFEYVGDDDWNHCEGGLWLQNGELVDYDGVFALPKPVFRILNKLGIKMDETFDPEYADAV